jgi:hypothetical protein
MILSYEECDVITTATSATQFITTLAVTWATAEGRELISNEDVAASIVLMSTIGRKQTIGTKRKATPKDGSGKTFGNKVGYPHKPL